MESLRFYHSELERDVEADISQVTEEIYVEETLWIHDMILGHDDWRNLGKMKYYPSRRQANNVNIHHRLSTIHGT